MILTSIAPQTMILFALINAPYFISYYICMILDNDKMYNLFQQSHYTSQLQVTIIQIDLFRIKLKQLVIDIGKVVTLVESHVTYTLNFNYVNDKKSMFITIFIAEISYLINTNYFMISKLKPLTHIILSVFRTFGDNCLLLEISNFS